MCSYRCGPDPVATVAMRRFHGTPVMMQSCIRSMRWWDMERTLLWRGSSGLSCPRQSGHQLAIWSALRALAVLPNCLGRRVLLPPSVIALIRYHAIPVGPTPPVRGATGRHTVHVTQWIVRIKRAISKEVVRRLSGLDLLNASRSSASDFEEPAPFAESSSPYGYLTSNATGRTEWAHPRLPMRPHFCEHELHCCSFQTWPSSQAPLQVV